MPDPTWKPTACILCECNCGIEVQLGGADGRRLNKFKGDRRHPVSKGYACEKAHRLDFYQNGDHRLMQPQKRRPDGSFETIGWDQAIAEVAQRLAAVRDTHGGEKIFYYGGGGQGNHLPGAYATSTRRLLGSRFKSSALAQEKTGEFMVAQRMIGAQTRGDFEHCQVGMFLGKNPWHSHSIPRARVTLKALSKDPERTLIVVDPRRTKTAELADIHLQVRPGTDAWLLSAMVATLFQEDLLDHDWLAAHAEGVDAVRAAFAEVPIGAYAQQAGLDEAQVRQTTRVIAAAGSFASFEDLGVQMNRHSTVVSYLHRLLWLLTGNLGKPGTHYMPRGLVRFAYGEDGKQSPVAGAPIISGLVPCNVIAEEILTDHPDRYRAMIVEAANPAHSLADSQHMAAALSALDTLVVIDVTMSETARLADYVLPAASQYEKAEATFFNFEFPENHFHLRRRLFAPQDGPLPEAEIHARLCEALGGFDADTLAPLHAAAQAGLTEYGTALFTHVMANPGLRGLAAVILYRTLGPVLPADAREGAVLLGLAFRAAMSDDGAMARAGFGGPAPVAAMQLFQAIIDTPSGVVMQKLEWGDVRIGTHNGLAQLHQPQWLDAIASLEQEPPRNAVFPFVLSAGERRSFTANTIIRDPAWRGKDPAGALRIHPADADKLGLASGDAVVVHTARGQARVTIDRTDTMQPGHISLPNGTGLAHPGATEGGLGGVAPNQLTSSAHRDPFAGTPLHKFVPARLEPVPPAD